MVKSYLQKINMGKYVFKPYERFFPELFEVEKMRLTRHLTGEYTIHHVGSTAVPGLGGKGIIDMYVVVPENQLGRISDEVIKAGYMHRPRVGADQHMFHLIDLPDPKEGIRRYNLHINHPNAPDFTQAIKFRDYLRIHPQDLQKYAEIKIKAAKYSDGSKEDYMVIISPIMEKILKNAMKEN